MSAPIWMDVGLGEIPSPAELSRLAYKGHHVVLRITGAASEGELAGCIARLKEALPAHSVFTSGESQLTVFPVIGVDDVAQMANQLLDAAVAFRATARQLCVRLADALRLAPEALVDTRRMSGQLDSDWAYHFHGLECCFTNSTTGQVVDVRLSFGNEFGVLDPWFFHRFLKTTPKYSSLADELSDGFHDTARALDVLERSGHLLRIDHRAGDFVSSGLIAAGA